MHRTEVLIFRFDTDDFFSHFNGVGVLGVKTSDERIGFSRLYHHHSEIVALEHFVVGLLNGIALPLALCGQKSGIAFTPFSLIVMSQVDDFDAVEIKIELFCKFHDALIVAEKYRGADSFGLCLNGGFEHRGVDAFGKYDFLGVCACGIIQFLCELCLLTEQFAQFILISSPVCDGLSCNSTFDSGLCHGSGNLGDKTRVHGLGDKVQWSEREIVHLIDVVDNVRNRLLGQIGDGVYGSQLHLLIDGAGVNVQRSAEDIGEAYDVVYLVGIVGAAC